MPFKGFVEAASLVALPLLAACATCQDHPLFALRADGHSRIPRAHAEAIDAALRWLVDHQARSPDDPRRDGRFEAGRFERCCPPDDPCAGAGSVTYDVGTSALALLALMAGPSGQPGGAHYGAIERGLGWLVREQRDDGVFSTDAAHDFIYGQVIATLALCEAHGLYGGDRWGTAARRAVGDLAQRRHPYGGWRYQRNEDGDTSVTTWCAQTLAVAHAVGLVDDRAALGPVSSFYDRVTSLVTGRAGYTDAGQPSARTSPDHQTQFPPDLGEALTAAALYGRTWLDDRILHLSVYERAFEAIEASPPRGQPGGAVDFYYWYYGCYALASCDRGDEWRETLADLLLRQQRDDAHAAGSWDPVGAWGESGGRIYTTAMAALILQAPFRYHRPNPVAALAAESGATDLGGMERHLAGGRVDRFAAARERMEEREDLDAATREALPELIAIQQRAEAAGQRALRWLTDTRHYVDAKEGLEELADDFGDLAPGAEARQVLAAWRRDPRVRSEVRAIEDFRALQARFSGRKATASAVAKAMEAFLRKHQGTDAARDAEDWRRGLSLR